MGAPDLSDICKVISVSHNLIQIEILKVDELKKRSKQSLNIGTYVKISDDDGLSVIAVIQAYHIKDPATHAGDAVPPGPTFVLDAQPLGFLDNDGVFQRGGKQIAIPPTQVTIADREILEKIYTPPKGKASLSIGPLARDKSIDVPLNGDVFFGKHIAIVGSTGSGKSCAVAKIVQEGCRHSDDQEKRGVLNNAHVVVFDLHGEYATAFPRARVLDVSTLKVPYWLMIAEELEEIFIESREQNSHNQISQFRYAVEENKREHNPGLRVSYDTAVYFDIEEVYNYIWNMNCEGLGRQEGTPCPLLADDKFVEKRIPKYFGAKLKFKPLKAQGNDKVTKGPFTGEFDRFVLRLRTNLDSRRLSFLFKPRKDKKDPEQQKDEEDQYKTEDMEELLADITGYGEKDKANVTIIDLHGIPFEVHSLVVSLLSRIIFDVAFYLKRARAQGEGAGKKEDEIAFLVVYEEAHKYAPNSELAKFRSVTKSIERIAKEGRKYGVSLMIVSQRPSEISETVFSQCSSFIVMRLTNPTDQNYVRRLLPDAVGGLTDALPSLAQREAIVLGECLQVPTLLRIAEIEHKPHSDDVDVLQEWRKDWVKLPFEKVLDEMKQH